MFQKNESYKQINLFGT